MGDEGWVDLLLKKVSELHAVLHRVFSAEIRDTIFELIERLSRIENSIEIMAREFARKRPEVREIDERDRAEK